MATQKTPKTHAWETGQKGASPEEVPWVYDAGLDAYVLTVGGGATDAGFVRQSDGTLLFTAGAPRSGVYKAGGDVTRIVGG